MAFWIIAGGILCACILASYIYWIFKYATKSKSFDEAMAEQRKLERSLMRSKLKQNQSKKSKNVAKDGLQPEKRGPKTVPSQAAAAKDTKKMESVKNNPVVGVDKVDGNVNSSNTSKKKTDKAQAKSVPSNSNNVKSNAENADDNVARVDVNENTIKKKQAPVIKIDEVSSSPVDSNVNSKNTNETVTGSDGATNAEPEVVIKEKPAKANKPSPSEAGDNAKTKVANSSESNDKQRDTKKSISKGESEENIAKYAGNKGAKNAVDEKGATKETKSKQNAEEKSSRSEEKVVKHEEVKVEEKAPPSPFKNKKTETNVAENQPVAGDSVPSEPNAVKEPVVTKAEKAAAKKSNNAGANGGVPSGKTSPVAGTKGQKPSNNVKTAKKQTNDIKTLQKLSDESGGPVSVSLLMPLIAKAELSRSEYQNLIDLLLNKQQENCIDAEWIEGGRQDPMVKLKKQLAEKEKALGDEQEAHQAIQSKLKELRAELNVEKHTNRQLEESLNARQMDLQALNVRLQAMAEEKQNFSKQLQQLQSKLNEERMIINSLKEENNKTKTNLQHELLSQRQQLELHIAHLNEQHQQELMALETQLNQIASQLQEQEATNAQMTDEIRECVLIRERLVHQENQLGHLQQTVMQLEELRQIKAELERHVASGQFEVKRLNNELQQLTDQLNRRNADIEKFNCTIQNMKVENQELVLENSRNNEQIKFAYNEKAQLLMENEKLRNELQKLSDQCHSSDDVVRLQSELESCRNTIADKSAEIKLLNEHVAVLKNSEEQHVSRSRTLEEENKSVNELMESLKKQMEKNEELRRKNWKVMEALSGMEKTLETKVKAMQCLPHEIKAKERELVIQQMKNVLPVASEINVSSIADDKIWSSHLEKILQEINRVRQPPTFLAPVEETFVAKENNVNMLDELEKQNKQLQTMVSHYKSIISDTEGMLNSLQNHVEQEENRWSEQVQRLQAELIELTEERNSLLHKMKIQNGCVQNDVYNSEQKMNGIDKLPSILTPSSPVNKTMMSS